jgi:hypothetical protein
MQTLVSVPPYIRPSLARTEHLIYCTIPKWYLPFEITLSNINIIRRSGANNGTSAKFYNT